MLVLVPISIESIPDFEDTSYSAMTDEDKRRMVQESRAKRHDGAYFEMLSVLDGDKAVGFMNLYARSANRISIGPEIKKRYQRQGYGCQAETLALQYAKQLGYTEAVAEVREENAASIALHEKLGFLLTGLCCNKHGNTVRLYRKSV